MTTRRESSAPRDLVWIEKSSVARARETCGRRNSSGCPGGAKALLPSDVPGELDASGARCGIRREGTDPPPAKSRYCEIL